MEGDKGRFQYGHLLPAGAVEICRLPRDHSRICFRYTLNIPRRRFSIAAADALSLSGKDASAAEDREDGGRAEETSVRRDRKMKKNLTELVMILDRSGSMSGLEGDTIGGYNSMLRKQRDAEGEVLVSTVLFDDVSEVLYDRIPLKDMPKMTEKEYYVRGCTALLDAIGGAIHHIGNVHKYAREEDRPEKTIFVITTDGMENASRRYSYDKVKQMVERQKEKYGWEFLFLGANIDAIETAGRFGITADRAANYKSDRAGTALNYEVLADTLCEMRACRAQIDDSWKRRIDEDFDRRGR